MWAEGRFPARHVAALDTIEYGDNRQDKVGPSMETLARGGMLSLVGKRGRGKTQLATALARWWCFDRCQSVRYETAFAMLGDLKHRAYEDGLGATVALRPLATVGLLVIDEVQEMRNTDDDARWLTALLDSRYGAKRPTILLSNLQPEQLTAALGPSVSSRMQETGRVVVIDWPSFRSEGVA